MCASDEGNSPPSEPFSYLPEKEASGKQDFTLRAFTFMTSSATVPTPALPPAEPQLSDIIYRLGMQVHNV